MMFLTTSIRKTSIEGATKLPILRPLTLSASNILQTGLFSQPKAFLAYQRPQLSEQERSKIDNTKERYGKALDDSFDFGKFRQIRDSKPSWSPSSYSPKSQAGGYSPRSYDRGGSSRDYDRRPRMEYGRGFTLRPDPLDLEGPAPEWNVEELQSRVKTFDFQPNTSLSATEKAKFLKVHGIALQTTPPDFQPLLDFEDTPFSDKVKDLFKKNGFEKPTPVQSVGWSLALLNHDTIGVAETGSGKTLTFMLPLSEHVLAQGPSEQTRRARDQAFVARPRAIVLAPTRELVQQIQKEAAPYLACNKQQSATVYGGTMKSTQLRDLERSGGDIVIGTPGRLTDLLANGNISLERVSFVVFDEADRMLDMGFSEQIRTIMKFVPPVRQTMMWSATWPKEVRKLSSEFVKDAVRFNVGSEELMANKRIEQRFVFSNSGERLPKLIALLSQLKEEQAKAIVFINKKMDVEQLGWSLDREGLSCTTIHGDKSQNQRDDSMHAFRRTEVQFLLATDVAARGLDVKDVKYVINFDAPLNAETYVHRIGRTGRAGAQGVSVTFFTPSDASLASEYIPIIKEANQELPQQLLDYAASKSRSFGKSYSPFNSRGGGGGGGYGNRQSRDSNSRYNSRY